MLLKRIIDFILSTIGVIILSPILILVAIWIKIDSKGPILFCQERIGYKQKPFHIYKFRTMVTDAEKYGKQITIGNDSRITSSGIFLRKYKIDELPQLFNVIKGEMSLVGPRPEVPRYVNEYPLDIKEAILSVPPGITDFASIEYKNENFILQNSKNPEEAYIKEVLPDKLRYCLRYVKERNVFIDMKIIFKTVWEVCK